MRTPQDLPRRFPRGSRRTRITILVVVIVLIVLVASLRGLARFWLDYLWFQSVGFTSVFRGVLLTKVLLSVVFVVVFFLMMWGNLIVADRVAPLDVDPADANDLVNRYRDVVAPRARWIRIVTSVIFALLAGAGTDREWNNWDLFRYSVSFGVKDPQFHHDVGFYVFKLPFIEFFIGWLFEAFIVVFIVSAVYHYLNGSILPQSPGNRVTSAVKAHLSVLLGVLAVIKGVDYYFERLELVLSHSHVVDGATATSVHANEPALKLLMVIAGIAAVLFLLNIRQRGWMLPVVGVGMWFLVAVIIGDAYPALYQALRVDPSEQTREAPYIQRNIDATQTAYNIGPKNVTVETDPNYQYTSTIDSSQIGSDVGQPATVQQSDNQQTLANVRLLDPAVSGLGNTFNKYQSLRNYYSFSNITPDRYVLNVNGKPTEEATVTAVRELNSSVPSGFVNQRLFYTHGYGAVVAPISQNGINADGTPNFTLSGLPPTGQPSLSPKGSEIYFGEDLNSYVIANTKTAELDYESNTGQNITTKYAGGEGVAAGSLFRRAAFALALGDPNFVLSGQISPSSRVIYVRNIQTMAQKAAPFLKFDSDPYSVVLNNSVYWVIDAYTTTNNYPYSQTADTDRVPSGSGLDSSFNYVRNSVKVVINAYSGKMYFVDMGTGDPILKVYEKAFPDLFTSLSKFNSEVPGMQAHFRYPEDLFRVQTNMYGRYHLSDASDFYNQAQAWAVSPDPGSGELSTTTTPDTTLTGTTLAPTVARLQPQYILAHLPGSKTPLSFMLITPFVPISSSTTSQNLTAYMTASSDPSTYGQLTVFETPPGETVDGPSLISNAIRSNTEISQELTLYDQKGSQVELGEVSIVPIDQTLLYVQPVYVESSANPIPTLRDVVVVYDGQAYHSSNVLIDGALCQISNPAPDGSQPFAAYCNTSAANRNTLAPTTGTGNTNTSPSTPTTTTTTTTTAPSSSGTPTVASLLAQAQADLKQAQTATAAGNKSAAATYNNKAQAALAQANELIGGG